MRRADREGGQRTPQPLEKNKKQKNPPLCQPVSRAKLARSLWMGRRALLLEPPQALTEARTEDVEKAPRDLVDESRDGNWIKGYFPC